MALAFVMETALDLQLDRLLVEGLGTVLESWSGFGLGTVLEHWLGFGLGSELMVGAASLVDPSG